MNDVCYLEVEELSGVFSEVKMKWRDGWIHATLEPAGICPFNEQKLGTCKAKL